MARDLALRMHRAAASVFEGWHIEVLQQRRVETTPNRVLERLLKRRLRLDSFPARKTSLQTETHFLQVP